MRGIMKWMVIAVTLVIGLAFITSTASAKICNYHQWPEHRACKPKPVPVKPIPTPAPVPEKIVLEGVNFDTGSAKIKSESYGVLDKNADVLMKHKDLNIKVVGYTDDRGSIKMNDKLSAARANSVKEYLIKKGVDANRISSEGKGPADPVADNKTTEGRAHNRRIELHTTK